MRRRKNQNFGVPSLESGKDGLFTPKLEHPIGEYGLFRGKKRRY